MLFKIVGISFAVMMAVLPWVCTPACAETSAYFTVGSPGAGYDTGLGLAADHVQRINDYIAVQVAISGARQKKEHAASGYTYGMRGELRGYVHHNVYLSAGYGVSGYRSEFADGRVWEKRGWQPHFGIGYDTESLDLWASYLFRESDTPNKVSAIKAGASWRAYGGLGFKLMWGVTHLNFSQNDDRKTDLMSTFGIGWEF